MVRVVVMGVAGCGKSTVGAMIAEGLGVDFQDADDFHPDSSVEKMMAGTPLSDDDRWPWLESVGRWLSSRDAGVIACSALRRSYRDVIRSTVPDAVFVHLAASHGVLSHRLDERHRGGHFLGPGMLLSQEDILEPLDGDERGLVIDTSDLDPDRVSGIVRSWIESELG